MGDVAEVAPRKVLILWADGESSNLGVRALAVGAATLIRRTWGESAQIEFQSFAPQPDQAGFGLKSVARDIFNPWGPIKSRLRGFDLVFDIGAGDSFTDIYGFRRLANMTYVRMVAAMLGRPVVMGPQTIGPFAHWWGKLLARLILARTAVIMVRDHQSWENSRVLGFEPNVHATDLVFALPVSEVPEKRYDVLLNVSGLLWRGDRHVDSSMYRNSVYSLIGELRSRGRSVALLPHVLTNASSDDDSTVVTELARELGVPALEPSGLLEVRDAIAAARVVVGARMHACLNALSVGTPAIPWAYSRKFAPLMDDLGWPYTVDLRTVADPVAATLQYLEQIDAADLASVRNLARERLAKADEVLRPLLAMSLRGTADES